MDLTHIDSPTEFTLFDSPVGPLLAAGGPRGLTHLLMDAPAPPAGARRRDAAFAGLRDELAAYFAGDRPTFTMPLAAAGSPFEHRVWAALAEVPYGATVSYGELAGRIGAPGAARAVGLANSRNPIAILVPCHRVVGADGRLTGYAGGLPRKRWLLDLEAGVAPLPLEIPAHPGDPHPPAPPILRREFAHRRGDEA